MARQHLRNKARFVVIVGNSQVVLKVAHEKVHADEKTTMPSQLKFIAFTAAALLMFTITCFDTESTAGANHCGFSRGFVLSNQGNVGSGSWKA